MSTGLVLGKFAPFHNGHKLLVDASLRENDHTVVMVYDCPLTIKTPLSVRASWISKIYSSVPKDKLEVVKCWAAPNEVSNDPSVKKMHEKYILKILNGRKIDNFYSSEFYGKHVSKALKAKDRRIDEAREEVPISGTEIRNMLYGPNPLYAKLYVHPIVYSDLVSRVLLIGAPSTGKTTLARALARRYNTVWVPEYGRAYWARNNQNRRLTTDQLDTIALTHRKMVFDATQKANKYLFVDTDASVTRRFCQYYHGRSTRILDELTIQSRWDYDIVVVCGDEIPYENTADRSGEMNRMEFQSQIMDDLITRKIRYGYACGNLQERLELVDDLIYTSPKV